MYENFADGMSKGAHEILGVSRWREGSFVWLWFMVSPPRLLMESALRGYVSLSFSLVCEFGVYDIVTVVGETK